MVETEVKVSLSDLRAERNSKDLKHREMSQAMRGEFTGSRLMPNKFYFAVPESLSERAEKAVKELYPHAGLLVLDDQKYEVEFQGRYVQVLIKAPLLKREDQDITTLFKAVEYQSRSLVWLLHKAVECESRKNESIYLHG